MVELKHDIAVAKGSRRLADAVRAAKIAAAQRSDIVVDIREAEKARLGSLADEMLEVADAVPPTDDLFDFTLSEGPQPRYWVDGTAHISMARDRTTYRFMRETRLGRVTLAESTDVQRMVDAVTEYVAERMVERLGRDVPITYEQVLAQAGPDATIGRPHIADALVANGVVPDRSTAFEHLLSNSGPYHVGHYAIDPVRAVTLVRAAGGVPVMAHPFADVRGRVVGDAVIEEMIDAGLLGLEAHHRDHTPEQVRHARDLARTHDLLVTGSSDYHGDGKPNRLGENTTEPDQYERLVALATSDVGVVRGR